MRSSLFCCLVFACLLALVAAWTKEDHEIFRLRDELELAEGEGLTFYDYVGIKPSASQKEIEKAYRKKSAQLHPDKAERNFVASQYAQQSKDADGKGSKPRVNKKPSQREIKQAVKLAKERYQRLTVIKQILTSESRVRYDHFVKNGFPQWRSTGYYYERFRPGLFTTLIGLWVFCAGGVHYGILLLNHRQHKAFVQRTITKARKDAYGPNSAYAAVLDTPEEPAASTTAAAPAQSEEGAPEPRNRKERRMMEKMQAKESKAKPASKKKLPAKPAAAPAAESAAPTEPKRRVLAANGKSVLLVAKDGSVYLEEEDEDGNAQELLMNPEDIETPTFTNTALVRAPMWLFELAQAKISGKAE